MVLSVLITIVFTALMAYGIFRIAVKAWRRAPVVEKMEEIKQESELAKVVSINKKKVQRDRQKIKDLKNL